MRALRLFTVTIVLLGGSVTVFHALGEQQVITAADGQAIGFGKSVAMDDDNAVVGAHNGDCGAAYVLVRQSGQWTQQQKLVPGDASDGCTLRFGGSVAISGDRVIVGAQGGSAAYIFVRQQGVWSELQKLTITGAPFTFGLAVAILGDTALVGAPASYNQQGSVYVFTQEGGLTGAWTMSAELNGEGNFGWSVALSESRAIVGAPEDYEIVPYGGAAFIYRRPEWIKEAKLVLSNVVVNTYFGHDVDIDGGWAIVGTVGQGSAYIFKRTLTIGGGVGWSQAAQLTEPLSSSAAYPQHFGYSVALSGGKAAVGPSRTFGHPSPAHVFSVLSTTFGSFWVHAQELMPTDLASSDLFGESIDIYGNHVIVGAPGERHRRIRSIGSAYYFNVGPRLQRSTIYLYPKPNPAKIGDPFDWVMDLPARASLDATIGVFALTADGRAQLLGRQTIQHSASPSARSNGGRESIHVYSTPAFPSGLPPAIALLLVMFDNESGGQLLLRTETVGDGRYITPSLRRRLRNRVQTFATSLTLKQLNVMNVGSLDNLSRRSAAVEGSK